MLHEDNMWMLLATCENLLMLKMMHDAGYDVSTMGNYAVHSDMEHYVGDHLFYTAISTIFGSFEDVGKDEDDPYFVQRIVVPCQQLEAWLQYDESFVRNHIESFFHVVSDYEPSEMKIEIAEDKKGFYIEMYELSGSCPELIQGLLKLKLRLDELDNLVIEKTKGE